MTASTVAAANIATHFQKQVNHNYIRKGRYGPFIGKDDNSIIQIKQDLKKVSIPLVGALAAGEGQKGSAVLTGNEKALSNFAFELTPTHYREGVIVDNEENEKSEFQLKNEARPALTSWAMELKRDHITQALGAVEAGGTYLNYGSASAAQLDTWNTNNSDRILYGNAIANLTAGDHTTSLGTIDSTNDKASAATLRLAKQLAEEANPIVRPFKVEGDDEYYIYFCDAINFRNLQQDSEIVQANREARARNLNNPIFTGGDLIYDGIIIKKVADMKKFISGDSSSSAFDGVWGANATADGLDNAGATASAVSPAFLCGSQAIGFGLGKMPNFSISKEDDYGHKNGVAVTLKHDIKKMFYNNKQHGVVSVFSSGA